MNPVVAVLPWDGLVHGQQVLVGGLGFTPNSQIGFAECEAGATGIDGCDLATSGYATANALGGFLGHVTVRRVIRTGSGAVDCVSPPGACEIGAANLADFSVAATVRIRFDPSVPPAPPPAIAVSLVVGQIASADGQGAFSTPFLVQTVIHTVHGTVDCHPAGACILRAANLSDFTQAAQQPLGFAKPQA